MTVLQAQLALLAADPTLLSLLGGPYIDMRGSVELVEQIPGIYWSLPSIAPMEETEEPATVQWDIFAHSFADAVAIESRVKKLLHRELAESWGGVKATSQYAGSTELPDERSDVTQRVMQTEISVARQRAA